MLLNKIPLVLLILVSANCFSQNKQNPDISGVTKITFFDPGISFEKRIGKFQSLYAQAFMNTSISISYSDYFGNTSSIYFDPAFTLQYRYYYNSAKREAKGKRTEMNSLNYVSAIEQTTFSKNSISSSYYSEKDRRAINTIGIAWGFQRNYHNRFSVDFNIGEGYLYTRVTTKNNAGQFITKYAGQFTAVGQINLGFWLNKRN